MTPSVEATKFSVEALGAGLGMVGSGIHNAMNKPLQFKAAE
jgi:hypothetical protein